MICESEESNKFLRIGRQKMKAIGMAILVLAAIVGAAILMVGVILFPFAFLRLARRRDETANMPALGSSVDAAQSSTATFPFAGSCQQPFTLPPVWKSYTAF